MDENKSDRVKDNQIYTAESKELERAADVAVRDVLKIEAGERVLIVTNPPMESHNIAVALHNAAAAAGAYPILLVQATKSQLDFADDAVIQAISSQPEVFISISAQKLGKDRYAIANPYESNGKTYDHVFHYLMATGKVRAFWSPSVTADMFARTVPIDYTRLAAEAKTLKQVLDEAVEVHITSPAGTDIRIGTRGRRAFVDDGDLSLPGAGGNLPAGETFISPELNSSNGLIVFDGSISLHNGDRIVREPVEVQVENGFVQEVKGGSEAEMLEETISYGESLALKFEKDGRLPEGMGSNYVRNARNLGELGIGLNPAAQIRGQMLEDEKAYNTAHIAIGANYDDDAPALIHLDCLMRNPSITAMNEDGSSVPILVDGALVDTHES